MEVFLRHGHLFVDDKESILQLHERGFGARRFIDYVHMNSNEEKNRRADGVFMDPNYEAMLLLDEEVYSFLYKQTRNNPNPPFFSIDIPSSSLNTNAFPLGLLYVRERRNSSVNG